MRVCFVTGKTCMFGNNKSHANNKTKRKFNSNIQSVVLYSKLLGNCRVKVTPNGIKTIEKKGGLDNLLETAFVYGVKGKELLRKYMQAKNAVNVSKDV